MQTTDIPWATHVWNHLKGCSRASEGCDNCYAKGLAHRFHRPWGHPVYHPETTEAVLKYRKPGARVFVCSVSDLFHEEAVEVAQSLVWDVAYSCPHITFIVLTKRAANMRAKLSASNGFGHGVLPNIWLGVSVETQHYVSRIADLLASPAAVRFVSVEPMLEPVDLGQYLPNLDGVFCGPETGTGHRPFEMWWHQHLEAACVSRGVPFFSKLGGNVRREYPAPLKSVDERGGMR